MDLFKKASKQKLRFSTDKGLLTTEQLWDLSLKELDNLAIQLQDKVDYETKKTFLKTKKETDIKSKLMFDIVVDILETKQEDQELAQKEKEAKEYNRKIDEIIAKKKEQSLEDKSIEELEKMRYENDVKS